MSPLSSLRDEDEIVRAHDLLEAIVLGEIQLDFRPDQIEKFSALLTVLCWVLKHDHDGTKAIDQLLRDLRTWTKEAGYEERRIVQ